LAGFNEQLKELDALGAKVVAASVDPVDKAKIVADEVAFPVGYGVTRETAEMLGSWWEERRAIIQPSEFIVEANGTVLTSSYSSGPLGRIDAADVVRWLKRLEAQKAGTS
jgi:peroxiredoxin